MSGVHREKYNKNIALSHRGINGKRAVRVLWTIQNAAIVFPPFIFELCFGFHRVFDSVDRLRLSVKVKESTRELCRS